MKQSLLGVLVWIAGSGSASAVMAQPEADDAAAPRTTHDPAAKPSTGIPSATTNRAEPPTHTATEPPAALAPSAVTPNAPITPITPIAANPALPTAPPTAPSPVRDNVGTAPSSPVTPGATSPTPPPTKTNERLKSPWGDIKPCQDPEAEKGSDLSTDCAGVFGIRGSVTRTRGVAPGDQRGLMLSVEGEEYVRRGIWTARTLHRLGIGGGEAGFEGIMMAGWAGGIRIPISPSRRHGPLLRLGVLGYLRGNDAYYASLLELPQLQLGYQYQRGKTVVELGATGGAVLVGRNRIGDSERRVLGSGFEYGGYAALQFPWVRFGVSSVRLPSNDGLSTPVDVFEGTLCARIGGFALCADARRTATRAVVAANAPAGDVRSLYAGLTVGVTRE